MRYEIDSVKNNPIIRKYFLKSIDNGFDLHNNYHIIDNVIWTESEITDNIINIYLKFYTGITKNDLAQCPKFVQNLLEKTNSNKYEIGM